MTLFCVLCHRFLLTAVAALSCYSIHLLLKSSGIVGKFCITHFPFKPFFLYACSTVMKRPLIKKFCSYIKLLVTLLHSILFCTQKIYFITWKTSKIIWRKCNKTFFYHYFVNLFVALYVLTNIEAVKMTNHIILFLIFSKVFLLLCLKGHCGRCNRMLLFVICLQEFDLMSSWAIGPLVHLEKWLLESQSPCRTLEVRNHIS